MIDEGTAWLAGHPEANPYDAARVVLGTRATKDEIQRLAEGVRKRSQRTGVSRAPRIGGETPAPRLPPPTTPTPTPTPPEVAAEPFGPELPPAGSDPVEWWLGQVRLRQWVVEQTRTRPQLLPGVLGKLDAAQAELETARKAAALRAGERSLRQLRDPAALLTSMARFAPTLAVVCRAEVKSLIAALQAALKED